MIRLRALVVLLAAAGCAPHRAPGPATPADVVAAARLRTEPFGLRARFSASVRGPSGGGPATGVLLLRGADRARLELYSPVGTTLLVAAASAGELRAWLPGRRAFLRADAAAASDALLGGAVRPGDLLALVQGRLPAERGRVVEARDAGEGTVAAVLELDDGTRLDVVLDARRGLLRSLDGPGFRLEVPAARRVCGRFLPARLVLDAGDWHVELDLHTWEEPGRLPDSAFALDPPPGVEPADLVDALRPPPGPGGGGG